MASDDPIEPIHQSAPSEPRPEVGLRSRGYRPFSRHLENLLRWKIFESLVQPFSKQRREAPETEARDEPKQPPSSDFDTFV